MNMNPAHWHLLVNHLPIIGGLMATFILLWGMLRRNVSIANLSFFIFILCAVFSIIATTTGESAEHYLKGLNAIEETYLERHVSAANIANYGMITIGALSLLTLVFERVRNVSAMPYIILIASIVVFVLMARAGTLGGDIMHKEIRTDSIPFKF